MPRPTRSEIDAEIIDRAAGLFARHGFANTSLQQIAEAVKYSKAGLLHHYPSKQAIYEAAIRTGREKVKTLVTLVEGTAHGIERDRAVVEATIEFSFDWPGLSALGNSFIDNDQIDDPDLAEMGLMMLEALGVDTKTADEGRIVRVTSAFAGLGISSMTAVRLNLKREWRGHIIAAAMDALGHTAIGPKPTR